MGKATLFLALFAVWTALVASSPRWREFEDHWEVLEYDMIEVNCEDATIRTAVDQQVALFDRDDQTFYTDKIAVFCRSRSRTRPSYEDLKRDSEINICFERLMRTRQQVPAHCNEEAPQQQNQEQVTCTLYTTVLPMPCSAAALKENYCKRNPKADDHIAEIKENYVRRGRCAGIDPTGDGLVKTEWEKFLQNPVSYIDNDMVFRRTLENDKIWNDCFGGYLQMDNGQRVNTAVNCESRVSESEQTTMRQRNWNWNFWNQNQPDEKQQLLESAIEANDLGKFVCLVFFKGTRSARTYNYHIGEFITAVAQKQRFSSSRVQSGEAQQTANNIENGNFMGVGYPPGFTGSSGEDPTPSQMVQYDRKMDGACKILFDKYDPSGSSCTAYSAQLDTLSRVPDFIRFVNGKLIDRESTTKDLLESNNNDPKLALCLLKANIMHASGGTADVFLTLIPFCSMLESHVVDQQLKAVYENPDCNQAGQLAGVTFGEMGTAIANRQYDTLDRLKKSMRQMTPYGYATFHSCVTRFVMTNLQVQCRNAPYAQRVSEIRTYVQQIDADTTLSDIQKMTYIKGRLMQGGNKGDVQMHMCDTYAIVDGATSANDAEERSKMLKWSIMRTLNRLKKYEEMVNFNGETCSSNMPLPIFDLMPFDEEGDRFLGVDFGRRFRGPFNCGPRSNNMRQCMLKRVCDDLIQLNDQTCDASLRSTVDSEWQNLMNAQAASGSQTNRFNFEASLRSMIRNISDAFPPTQMVYFASQAQENTRKCAIKLTTQKLKTYWDPVDQCYVLTFIKKLFDTLSRGPFMPPVEPFRPPMDRFEPPMNRLEPPMDLFEPPMARFEPPVDRFEPPPPPFQPEPAVNFGQTSSNTNGEPRSPVWPFNNNNNNNPAPQPNTQAETPGAGNAGRPLWPWEG